MQPTPSISKACRILTNGGVIAYPTEAVYGLGCDPFNPTAIDRIFQIKGRHSTKQFILIAASFAQIRPLLGKLDAFSSYREMIASWPGPHTWICPAAANLPNWLWGSDRTLAVRVTAHPVAAELCKAWGGPLVSTSANRSGQSPLRSSQSVKEQLHDEIDYLVPGDLGGLAQPTSIRLLSSGETIR